MADVLFYEDSVAFDQDDPDFVDKVSHLEHDFDHIKSSVLSHSFSSDCIIPSTMSCGIINQSSYCHPQSNWLNRSESIESFDSRMDSMLSRVDPEYHGRINDHSMTLEDIRSQYNSCYSCGVSWSDNHVSLDCSECGGYSLCRPCPLCDGKCSAEWQRDVSMSHSVGKAHWEGECHLAEDKRPSIPSFLAEDVLIQGLEDLSTSSSSPS